MRSRPLVSRAAIPQQRALAPARFPTMPKRFMAVSGGEPAVIPVATELYSVCTHACGSGTAMQWTRLSTDTHAHSHTHTPKAARESACQAGRPIGATVTRWRCMLVQVPAMGDSISEGTIAAWHKKVGDQVMLH